MEKEINELIIEEVQEEISELENLYAELLAGGCNGAELTPVWRKIQMLQLLLQEKTN